MLTFFILLILGCIGFNHGAAIRHPSENVGIDLAIPRGQTREEYLQSILDYWTPERMASAIPKDIIFYDESHFRKFNRGPYVERAAEVLANSALLAGMTSSKPLVAGKVYFTMANKNYLCSASAVNAKNRDTVITAGHCMYDTSQQIYASNWVFVPAYSLGSRPLGTFTMRKLVTKAGWMDNGDFNYDVGIALMNTNEKGQHVQDVAGGLGITLDAPREATTTAFGYPVNMNSGESVSNCVDKTLSPTFLADFTGLQLPCGMTGGSSGGPWIQAYDVNAQTGQQVSLVSFGVSNRPNNIFGPYFIEDNIGSLYRVYHTQ